MNTSPPSDAPTSAARARRWRPPISAALVFGFGGLIAAAVATVLLISLQVAERNTIELSRNAAELSVRLLTQNLERHLEPARSQTEFLAKLLSGGEIALDDTGRIQDLLLGSLAAAPQITGVAFVRDDLYAMRAGRSGGRYEVGAGSSLDKPEIRLAVRKSSTEDGFSWGDIVYLPQFNTVISLRAPVRRNGAFRGTVSTVVSISELSGYLAEGDVSAGGRSFVLYGRDRVLAHPALAGGPRGLSSDRPLPRLSEVGDPVLANLWTEPVGSFADILAESEVDGRVIAAANDRYVVLYRTLSGYGETPWLVGIYYRLADVNEPVRRLNYVLMAGGGTFVIAAALAWLLGRSLSRPIRRLEAAAEAIRNFDIEAAPRLSGNLFRELDAAAKAFNAMLAGLRWFEIYVPKPLVLRLMRQSAQQTEFASEERPITVLFTDIVGFTRISRKRSATELASFLNRHFALLGACIEAEGGTVDKYIGDSVMAFWGAPADEPDHAVRACRAALRIADVMKTENARRQSIGLAPVRLRIGIHTGTAIVGNVGAPGRINYTLIGDTVNIAQRLEQLGKTVDTGDMDVIALIGSTTAAALPPEIAVATLGPQPLHGHGEPMNVFRLA